MKKNATKRALLTSVIALLLCVSMLVGTTFAWFTDSVTSANNIIQSGNLDVEMYYQVEGQSDWTKVTSETNVFMENALWEPGHTEVVKLKIVNEGSLALKYNLGVNIVSETASVNQKGDVFRLSEYIKFGVVAGAQTYTREQAVAAVDATATPLKTAYNSGVTNLYVDDPATTDVKENEKIVTMVVYMPTSVGNEANYAKGAAQPTIKLGLNLFATQLTAESDSFNNQYDKDAIIATTAAEAQAALDNAEPGTTIQLVSGVNYGTLVFRQNASKKVVDITTMGGDAAGNEKFSSYEDITILGSAGAVVDQIDFQVGWIGDSLGASFIEIKNLTIEGVTFSGTKTALNLQGKGQSSLGIDGLTIKNCKMNDADGNDRLVFQQMTGYKELNDKTTGEYVMTAGVKNLTITGCEVTGAYMVIESRAMENLTITNNVFKGIKARDMLITSDTTNYPAVTYTGTITIIGNTSIEGEERFVRGSLNNSYAVVVIKDNTIINYMGADADYIKVTDGNNVTVENNPMTRAYKAATVDELKAALNAAQAGETVILAADITLTSDIAISNANFVLDGNGHTITGTSTYGLFDITGGTVALKNVNFVDVNGPVIRTVGVKFNATNVVVKESSSTKQQGLFRLYGENTITNCTFKDNTCNMVITLNYDGVNNDPQIIEKCVFEGNTCNDTAVVYYVTGAGASINNNKFIGNSVNSNGHAAVLYCEEATIMGNEFTGNDVDAAGKRVGVIVLDAGVVSGNDFSGNAIDTTASESYKATIVSKGDVGTELVLSNNTATDYANVKGNTITVA